MKKSKYTIRCAEKSVYGRILIYPLDATQARIISTLTRKHTLDYNEIKALEELGFIIELEKLPK